MSTRLSPFALIILLLCLPFACLPSIPLLFDHLSVPLYLSSVYSPSLRTLSLYHLSIPVCQFRPCLVFIYALPSFYFPFSLYIFNLSLLLFIVYLALSIVCRVFFSPLKRRLFSPLSSPTFCFLRHSSRRLSFLPTIYISILGGYVHPLSPGKRK